MVDRNHKGRISNDADVNPRFSCTKGTEPKLRIIEKNGFYMSYKITLGNVAREYWGCILTVKKKMTISLFRLDLYRKPNPNPNQILTKQKTHFCQKEKSLQFYLFIYFYFTFTISSDTDRDYPDFVFIDNL